MELQQIKIDLPAALTLVEPSLNMSSFVCVCRSGGLHLSGGPGNGLTRREAAEETLCHRLPGVRAQHRTRLHQTGQCEEIIREDKVYSKNKKYKFQSHIPLISSLSVCLSTEISRARHLQSPPPDVEEGGASTSHAEKSALQSQVEQTVL